MASYLLINRRITFLYQITEKIPDKTSSLDQAITTFRNRLDQQAGGYDPTYFALEREAN
ncbi:MAG: hypothetical protein LBN71_08870 [Tannerella sp.]|jgi:hypothetical protein|nr:hypothetical protein [Tannerella sp.]